MFHDTHEIRPGFGVHRFWDEVRTQGRSFAFEHGHGLGVLAFGRSYQPGLEALLDATPEEAAFIRRIFARLGAGVSDRQRRETAETSLARITARPNYKAAEFLGWTARAIARRALASGTRRVPRRHVPQTSGYGRRNRRRALPPPRSCRRSG